MKLAIVSLVFISCYFVQANNQFYSTPRGAQLRLTTNGLNYAASVGVRVLQQELTNKKIDSQSGSGSGVSWSAKNIIIRYVRVGNYRVTPLENTGIRISVGGISLNAGGRVSATFRKGWIKVSDSTNVKISGKNVGFTLDFKIGASNGKPYLTATSCSASIGDVDLDFDGGLSWVYNIVSSVFSGKIKDLLKRVMCAEGTKLINKEANNFLVNFPVQQNIENYAIINYAFENPIITTSYLDLLLRGEFLNPKNPVPSPNTPPAFDTVTSSSKMAYVWLSDFTLNTAGKVFHDTGLLKKLVGPLSKEIPASVRPFLNTKSFETVIPELYKRYPDRPLEFQLATNKPPTFEITQGNIDIKIFVRATVVVDKIDGSKLPVFYLDLNVDAGGSVFVKSVNNQLNVGGNIANFTFGAKIGGSVLGDINIPIDDPSIKQLVKGLVVENANPLLNKGFPIPKIKDLDFVNPQVSFVKCAIRVDTDIKYSG